LKDTRYKAVKSLIESKSFKKLTDIFEIAPVSKVREDIGANYNTLQNRILNPELMTLQNLMSLAELFDVAPTLLFELAIAGIKKGKK